MLDFTDSTHAFPKVMCFFAVTYGITFPRSYRKLMRTFHIGNPELRCLEGEVKAVSLSKANMQILVIGERPASPRLAGSL